MEKYYCTVAGKKTLDLNALAWDAPEHNGDYGYCPDDPYYNEIIEAFKSMKDVHRSGNVVRKHVPFTHFDAIITWYPKTKMVSWYFIDSKIAEI